MSLQLYLLRHAMAESWSPLGNDFSRPLTSTGKQHAQLVSKWALEALAPPDTILCSPARRTRETLAPFLARWPQLLANSDYVDSIYGASVNMLLTLVEDAFSYSERLMMVGHNPGLEQLLKIVLRQDQAVTMKPLMPGTFSVVEFPETFKRDAGAGKLMQMILEKELSDN